MRQYQLYIFDFDGTLGDTKECVIDSFQQTLVDNGLPKATREHIVHNMGLSLEQSFRILTEDCLDDVAYAKLIQNYRRHYKRNLTQKTLIFPDVKEVLAALKKRRKKISIATSKKTEFAELSCKFLKIDRYIDLYIGDDKVTNKKPHPEMLEHTLKELNIIKEDAVMIGDSTFDIEMGNSMEIDTIAVTWGAHSKEILESTHPTYIISSMKSLIDNYST